MRGEGKRHLILKKILAYVLVLTMILGIWTSVSNAAEQSEFNVEENTIEEAAEVRTDAEIKYFGEFRYDLSDKDIIDEENMEQYTEYKQCI